MKPLALILTLCALAFLPSALHAQAPAKTFVASFGNDANDGSRGSPKRNFQSAHDAVAAGGQIVVLDTAGYGQLNITKSLAITVPAGVNGFITVVGGTGNGITINGPSNVGVILRGLIIEGSGLAAGNIGVYSMKAVNLVLEGCTIRGFTDGVRQELAGSSTSLKDCVLLGCTNGFSLTPFSTGATSANISRCSFELNGETGLSIVNNNNTNAIVTVTVGGSLFYRNKTGIVAAAFSGSPAQARVLVSDCVITDNVSGVVVNGPGVVLSRGNNTLTNNGGGNAFSGTYGAQ